MHLIRREHLHSGSASALGFFSISHLSLHRSAATRALPCQTDEFDEGDGLPTGPIWTFIWAIALTLTAVFWWPRIWWKKAI